MIPKTLLLVIAFVLVGVTGVIVVNTSKNETTDKAAIADMKEVSDMQIAKNNDDTTSTTKIVSTSTKDIFESEEAKKINDDEQEDFTENKSETELEDSKKDTENTTNTNEEQSEPAKADTEVETIFEPLSVFCNSLYPTYKAGESVAWEVHASGGELPFSYEWTGTSDLSGNSKKVTKVYSEKSYDRTEKAHVTVTSNDKQSKNAECEIRILAEEVEEETVQQKQEQESSSFQNTEPAPQEAEQDNEVVQEEEPELSYNDLHCPKVVRLEDNQGNVSNPGLNYLKGTLVASEIDTLEVRVIAEDPNGDTLQFRFSPSSFSKNNPNLNPWGTNNTYSVLGENLLIGGNRTLFVSMDDGDDYSCIGANYDVAIKFTYDISE